MKQQNRLFPSHGLLRTALRVGLIAGFGMLAACAESEVRLSGEREDVFASSRSLSVNEAAFAELAGLGAPVVNDEFGHPGVTAAHDGGHLSVELPFESAVVSPGCGYRHRYRNAGAAGCGEGQGVRAGRRCAVVCI